MDFMDDEAELASTSESSRPSGSEGEDEDEMPRKKKKTKKKKKKRQLMLSDDEEDGEELDQDLEDLIDDNPDIEQEGEDEDEGEGKRKHEDSELEEDLEDDDYALLEENLGIKVKRKQKRKRIRMLQSDEESAKSSSDDEDDRDAIAKEIFEGDPDDAPPPEEEESQERAPPPADYGDLEQSEEEDDMDAWIVDEEGQPISKGKKKKHIIHDDAALQEAQDIFGVDFDFEEFDQGFEEGSDDEEDQDVRLKIISMNCRGLCGEDKRKEVWSFLKQIPVNIICLQDVHFEAGIVKTVESEWGCKYKVVICPYKSNARGVAVLFNKKFDFKINDSKIDEDGNYVLLDLTVENVKLSLVCLYGPNEDSPYFYSKLTGEVQAFGNKSVIMCGDFNLVLDPQKDTINYLHNNKPKARNRLTAIMNKMNLIDVWRHFNPDKSEFTWESKATQCSPKKRARLDFFLVSGNILKFITNSNIVQGYKTDHSSISLVFKIPRTFNNIIMRLERRCFVKTVHLFTDMHRFDQLITSFNYLLSQSNRRRATLKCTCKSNKQVFKLKMILMMKAKKTLRDHDVIVRLFNRISREQRTQLRKLCH